MFDRVVEWLEANPSDTAHAFGDSDVRAATIALFYRIVAVDGRVNPEERRWLRGVLRNRFAMSEGEADRLIGELSANESVGELLFPLTTVLNRSLSGEERAEVMRKLTELAFADGTASDVEVAELKRVRELLKLPAT